MADSSNNKYLAMVSTNDDRLGQLIAAMLTPLGFSVSLIHRGESRGEQIDDFALLILDGDPVYPISDLDKRELSYSFLIRQYSIPFLPKSRSLTMSRRMVQKSS